MSKFISSVAVTFSSDADADLVVTSVLLDPVVGCTIPHAMSFHNSKF